MAQIIGLAHRNAVSGYQRRYVDMPRPVVDLGPNRPLLWLRPDIESWRVAGHQFVEDGRDALALRNQPRTCPINLTLTPPRWGGGGSWGASNRSASGRKAHRPNGRCYRPRPAKPASVGDEEVTWPIAVPIVPRPSRTWDLA